jgi:hypothetical protein
MSRLLSKNLYPPLEEELEFLYCLVLQPTNNALINYISSKFNAIQEHSSRKLKLYDWIYSIKWMLDRYTYYDSTDFHSGLCVRHFNDGLFSFHNENLEKALDILSCIDNYEDIQYVGDKEFFSFKIPEVEKVENVIEENKNDFFSYDLMTQRDILNTYEEYNLYLSEAIECLPEDSDIVKYAINEMVRDKISEEFLTENNIELIEKVCFNLMQFETTATQETIKDDVIAQSITNEIFLNDSLILTAYYLQYILMAFGVSFTKNQTLFGVDKATGKQAEIMQRLLCAVSSKKWDKIEQKSNSYYKTINNMFKLDFVDDVAKNILIKQMDKVRIMLTQGGFADAIRILDEDLEKINKLGSK